MTENDNLSRGLGFHILNFPHHFRAVMGIPTSFKGLYRDYHNESFAWRISEKIVESASRKLKKKQAL